MNLRDAFYREFVASVDPMYSYSVSIDIFKESIFHVIIILTMINIIVVITVMNIVINNVISIIFRNVMPNNIELAMIK